MFAQKSVPDQVTAACEYISPQKAAAWLEQNLDHQRRLKVNLIERIAADIEADQYLLNGASICFDTTGALIDGQHRLHAICKAGRGVYSLVTRGVAPIAVSTIDSGLHRSLVDVLHMEGYSHPAALAALCVRLQVLKSQSNFLDAHSAAQITVTMSRSFLADNPHLPGLLTQHIKLRNSRLPLSAANYMVIIAATWNHELHSLAIDFFEDVLKSKHTEGGNPAHMLRDRVAASKSLTAGQISRTTKGALMVKAWNAYATGDVVNRLHWRQYGKKAELFPIITPLSYGDDT